MAHLDTPCLLFFWVAPGGGTESIILSASGPESMMLSAFAESVILSAPVATVLRNYEYFSSYLGYFPMIPTPPHCNTFQLIPLRFL
jgi:hypothetical protein